MITTSSVQAYVKENGSTTIVCPSCGKSKTFKVNQLKTNRHKAKMRCRCKSILDVHFEYRRNYRKAIILQGNYTILRGGDYEGGIIEIQNLSSGGVGFTVSGIHGIKKGQLIGVKFRLTDRHKSLIKKMGTVVQAKGNFIGCQFTEVTVIDSTNKALGFFLRQL